MRAAGVTGVAVTLTEGSPAGPAGAVASWADSGDVAGQAIDAAGAATDGAGEAGDAGQSVDVTLAGQAWRAVVRPTTPLVPASRAYADVAVLIASGLTSVLLATAALALAGARTRARRQATAAVAAGRREALRAQRAESCLRDRDAELRERTSELRERAAELRGFAAAAGENLHAPLTHIASYTDLLLEEAGPQLDAASLGFLDRIGGSTRRMLTLVDELLAYTDTSDAALRLAPVDLGRLTTDVVVEHIDALAQDARPSVDVGQLPQVTADASLIRQVLDHLVTNATRFVRHGSVARITVSARPDQTGWWRVEVADRGIGVPPDHRLQIFQPFHRTPAAQGFPGSGLGLAICRRIVDLHGGEIGVEPNPGGGSVFWFTVFDGAAAIPDERPSLAAGHA
jgi:signal transduction histidine kinase